MFFIFKESFVKKYYFDKYFGKYFDTLVIAQKDLELVSRPHFLRNWPNKDLIQTGQISSPGCAYFSNCLVNPIWVEVFKNGPSEICGRKPLKNLICLGRPYHFKFFKGCLSQILLGRF